MGQNPLQRKIIDKLYHAGFASVTRAEGRSTALMVDGARVEIKLSAGIDGKWRINLHRHGELDEDAADAYLFVLENVPGNASMPLYLILEAPIGVKSLTLTFSTLARKWAPNIDAWDTLHRISKRTRKRSKAA